MNYFDQIEKLTRIKMDMDGLLDRRQLFSASAISESIKSIISDLEGADDGNVLNALRAIKRGSVVKTIVADNGFSPSNIQAMTAVSVSSMDNFDDVYAVFKASVSDNPYYLELYHDNVLTLSRFISNYIDTLAKSKASTLGEARRLGLISPTDFSMVKLSEYASLSGKYKIHKMRESYQGMPSEFYYIVLTLDKGDVFTESKTGTYALNINEVIYDKIKIPDGKGVVTQSPYYDNASALNLLYILLEGCDQL